MIPWDRQAADIEHQLGIPRLEEDRRPALALIRASAELARHLPDTGHTQRLLHQWLQLTSPAATPLAAATLRDAWPITMYPSWLAAYRSDPEAISALPSHLVVLGQLLLLSPGTPSTDPTWQYVDASARQLDVDAHWLVEAAGWIWGTATADIVDRVAAQLDLMATQSALAELVISGLRVATRSLRAAQGNRAAFEHARVRCHALVKTTLARAEGLGVDRTHLHDLVRQLDHDLFRLAVVGEFKRGKSALITALVEHPGLLPIDLLPCTAEIIAIRYGDHERYERWCPRVLAYQPCDKAEFQAETGRAAQRETEPNEERDLRWNIQIPARFLEATQIEIIDTPGLNEDSGRARIARQEAQRADAALVVLDATQIASLQELDLIDELRARADSLILAISHADQVALDRWQDLRAHVRRRLERRGIEIPDERICFVSATAHGGDWDERMAQLRETVRRHLRAHCSGRRDHTLREQIETAVRRTRAQIAPRIEYQRDALFTLHDLEHRVRDTDAIHAQSRRELAAEVQRIAHSTALAAKLTAALDRQLPRCIEQVKQRASQWTSEHSPLTSPKKYINDIGQQATRTLRSALEAWAHSDLPPLVLAELRTVLGEMPARIPTAFHLISLGQGVREDELRDDLSERVLVRLTEFAPSADEIGTAGTVAKNAIAGALSAAIGFVIADIVLFYILGVISSFFALPLLIAAAVIAIPLFVIKGADWARASVRDKLLEQIETKLADKRGQQHLHRALERAASDTMTDLASSVRITVSTHLDELQHQAARLHRELAAKRDLLGTPEAIAAELARLEAAAQGLQEALDELEHVAAGLTGGYALSPPIQPR